MKSRDASNRSLVRTLRRRQRQHSKLLARVEKAATRLQRRKSRLLALEAKIADLERRVAEPRKQRAAKGAGGPLRRVRLVFNPSAGRDDHHNAMRLAQAVSALRAHGIDPDIGVKTSGKAARDLAREAARNDAPLVIVAAGDGTVEEVASQLVGRSTTLAIIPMGTMNNVARALGVPLDIDEACALIGMATTRHIDVGRVYASDRPEVEYFLEGAGVGLSAIAALAGQGIEKHRWHVLPNVLRRFMETKPNVLRISTDDAVIEAATRIVTVSNAPYMGRNMMVAPDARMDDGLLDVVAYDGMGDALLIKHFMATTTETPPRLPTYRTRHVRIVSDDPVESSSDKDLVAQGRIIDIEVVPGALAVIAGNGVGLGLAVEAAPPAARPTEPSAREHTNGTVQDTVRTQAEPSRT